MSARYLRLGDDRILSMQDVKNVTKSENGLKIEIFYHDGSCEVLEFDSVRINGIFETIWEGFMT